MMLWLLVNIAVTLACGNNLGDYLRRLDMDTLKS